MSTTDRLATDEAEVRQGFWQKARQTLGKVPFSEDAVAAFHCATDSATPLAIRATLMGALAYFILPFDAIPDILLGLGYTDDAAIMIAAYTAAKAHITEAHRARAREWLLKAQAS
jgi:uncharacterized membrane protein YkvA (DUF1232 family)